MRVLVVNAGSSSLKISALDDEDRVLFEREVDAKDARLEEVIGDLRDVDAVGHRIVHGGSRYRESVRIDGAVIRYLSSITDLAPLHLPSSLAAIERVTAVLEDVPAVACFDTMFHSGMPAAASTYPVPEEWRATHGVKRYGFHGFSHAYAARRAAEILRRSPADLKVVTCHLGSGASLAAVVGGRSVDTTMGFTPLEGVVMATRSGTVDPGAMLYLMRHAHLSEPELTDALDRKGGLLALAGTPDMREVLRRRASGDTAAELAFDVYVHRLRAGIAAMTAALGGLDALVFTGGVGENSPQVRSAAAAGLLFLGIELDAPVNSAAGEDRDVSAESARVRTLVVHAREDVELAREVRRVLS